MSDHARFAPGARRRAPYADTTVRPGRHNVDPPPTPRCETMPSSARERASPHQGQRRLVPCSRRRSCSWPPTRWQRRPSRVGAARPRSPYLGLVGPERAQGSAAAGPDSRTSADRAEGSPDRKNVADQPVSAHRRNGPSKPTVYGSPLSSGPEKVAVVRRSGARPGRRPRSRNWARSASPKTSSQYSDRFQPERSDQITRRAAPAAATGAHASIGVVLSIKGFAPVTVPDVSEGTYVQAASVVGRRCI